MDIRTIVTSGYNLWSVSTTTSGINNYGTIDLDYGWQLIAIPVLYGYWSDVTHKHVHKTDTQAKFKNYVLDQVVDLYGSNIIEVANTYPGDLQAFLSYVVGSTPISSPHNFNLIYTDNNSYEISGFWIKIIGPNAPYVISWGDKTK